jgi:hypothetical protein
VLLQTNVLESGPSSRPDDPPLLPGEKVQGVAREVTYLCPYSGPARGVLSVTNYRLHFRSMDRDTPYVVDVPLGVVSSIFCHKFGKHPLAHALCCCSETFGDSHSQIRTFFVPRLNTSLYLSWLLTFRSWGSLVIIPTKYYGSWKCQ